MQEIYYHIMREPVKNRYNIKSKHCAVNFKNKKDLETLYDYFSFRFIQLLKLLSKCCKTAMKNCRAKSILSPFTFVGKKNKGLCNLFCLLHVSWEQNKRDNFNTHKRQVSWNRKFFRNNSKPSTDRLGLSFTFGNTTNTTTSKDGLPISKR